MKGGKRQRTQQKLVAYARQQLGKPYRYGAKVTSCPRAFDCSSLVQWLYQRVGVRLPRRSLEQAACGRSVPRRLNLLQPGDLIFFTGSCGHYNPRYPQGIGHVAMCVGEGRVIHARGRNGLASVCEVPTKRLWRRRDLVVVRRLL